MQSQPKIYPICNTCKFNITPEHDGMCYNQGTPSQGFQCNDCHCAEFGYNIMANRLFFFNNGKFPIPEKEIYFK